MKKRPKARSGHQCRSFECKVEWPHPCILTLPGARSQESAGATLQTIDFGHTERPSVMPIRLEELALLIFGWFALWHVAKRLSRRGRAFDYTGWWGLLIFILWPLAFWLIVLIYRSWLADGAP